MSKPSTGNLLPPQMLLLGMEGPSGQGGTFKKARAGTGSPRSLWWGHLHVDHLVGMWPCSRGNISSLGSGGCLQALQAEAEPGSGFGSALPFPQFPHPQARYCGDGAAPRGEDGDLGSEWVLVVWEAAGWSTWASGALSAASHPLPISAHLPRGPVTFAGCSRHRGEAGAEGEGVWGRSRSAEATSLGFLPTGGASHAQFTSRWPDGAVLGAGTGR